MSERWRLFVASPIDDDLRRELVAAVERWSRRPDLEGLRWTDPDGWHLTLAFLGATDAELVPQLVAALEAVAVAHEPMRLATGGVGAFPSRVRARVAWYGIADPERRLADLARAVRHAVGVDASAPFRAHLTVARARREPVDLRAWIGDAGAPAGRIGVNGIELMRSHVARGPARYESIASVRLGAPARV